MVLAVACPVRMAGVSIGAPRQNGDHGQARGRIVCRWCGTRRGALPSKVLLCPRCDCHVLADIPKAHGSLDYGAPS